MRRVCCSGGKVSPSLYSRFRKEPHTSPQSLVICLVLFGYTVLGGIMFYSIENKVLSGKAFDLTQSRLNGTDKHRGGGFWEALFYAGTIYTTIGYGVYQQNSLKGRVATVVYALLGIPLCLIALDNSGKFLTALGNFCYREGLETFYRRCRCRKRKTTPERDADFRKKMSKKTMPLWIVLLVLFLWLVIMTGVFIWLENDWEFSHALYFVLISVSTVGLGDVTLTNYQYTLLYQFILFVGLSLFSMTMTLSRQKLDNLYDTMRDKIQEDYVRRLLEEAEYDIDDLKDPNNVYEYHQAIENAAEKKGKKIRNGLIMKFLMSKKDLMGLEEETERRQGMRNARTQTLLQAVPEVTQTEYSFGPVSTASRGIQTIESGFLAHGQMALENVRYMSSTTSSRMRSGRFRNQTHPQSGSTRIGTDKSIELSATNCMKNGRHGDIAEEVVNFEEEE